MRTIVTAQLANDVHYLLPPDPRPILFPVSNNVNLLNPILLQHGKPRELGFLRDRGLYWFSSSEISLDIDIGAMASKHQLLDETLVKLRRISRQAQISRVAVCYSWHTTGDIHAPCEFDDPEDLVPQESVFVPPSNTQKYDNGIVTEVNAHVFRTSITKEHLESLLTVSLSNDVHEDLIIDAIEAFLARDYRRTLVYAASGAEAAAETALTNAYVAALTTRPSDLRVRTIVVTENNSVHKDPVYEAISENSDFKSSLHERPLYLMKRSLLLDNQELYRRLLKLYRTRNSIIHNSTKPKDIYAIGQDSAEECLAALMQLLDWLGFPSDFHLPWNQLLLDNMVIRGS